MSGLGDQITPICCWPTFAHKAGMPWCKRIYIESNDWFLLNFKPKTPIFSFDVITICCWPTFAHKAGMPRCKRIYIESNDWFLLNVKPKTPIFSFDVITICCWPTFAHKAGMPWCKRIYIARELHGFRWIPERKCILNWVWLMPKRKVRENRSINTIVVFQRRECPNMLHNWKLSFHL